MVLVHPWQSMEKTKIRVIPRAKKERIEIVQDGLKVYLAAPAISGRANKRLVEVLAKYYNTKKYNISICSGEKSRNKTIRITSSK